MLKVNVASESVEPGGPRGPGSLSFENSLSYRCIRGVCGPDIKKKKFKNRKKWSTRMLIASTSPQKLKKELQQQ